jgi:hypothetical protein
MPDIPETVVLFSVVATTEDETSTLSQNVWQKFTDKMPYSRRTKTSSALLQLRQTYIAELTAILLLNVILPPSDDGCCCVDDESSMVC